MKLLFVVPSLGLLCVQVLPAEPGLAAHPSSCTLLPAAAQVLSARWVSVVPLGLCKKEPSGAFQRLERPSVN